MRGSGLSQPTSALEPWVVVEKDLWHTYDSRYKLYVGITTSGHTPISEYPNPFIASLRSSLGQPAPLLHHNTQPTTTPSSCHDLLLWMNHIVLFYTRNTVLSNKALFLVYNVVTVFFGFLWKDLPSPMRCEQRTEVSMRRENPDTSDWFQNCTRFIRVMIHSGNTVNDSQ